MTATPDEQLTQAIKLGMCAQLRALRVEVSNGRFRLTRANGEALSGWLTYPEMLCFILEWDNRT